MSTYPPILRPAMELIEEQAKTISKLNATITMLVERINLISGDMGYQPIGTDTITIPPRDGDDDKTSEDNGIKTDDGDNNTHDKETAGTNTGDGKTGDNTGSTTRRLYCQGPEIAGNGQAFYADTLTPKAEIFILDLGTTDGHFSVSPDKNLRQLGFENMLRHAVDCDMWPSDAISRELTTVQPGILRYNPAEDMWEITQNAIIKFS